MTRDRVAVIGAGVSGLTAAYLLSKRHDVVLFDVATKPGGHADTHDVATPDGSSVAVDTGFLVHNDRTYPLLSKLFTELGVRTQATEMSMSVRCDGCGLRYAGGKRGIGMVPACPPLALPRYARMMMEIPRFHRAGRALLTQADDTITLGGMLASGRYSRYFIDHFALPVVSAVWSAGEEDSLRYPARTLFRFLDNHGMLSATQSLRWRTVCGGSRAYVDKVVARIPDTRLGSPVRAIRRHLDGVEVVAEADTTHVDRVVLATHADQALALLADPTTAEKQTLGAFEYSENETWLHTDADVLPAQDRIRSSWNYVKPTCETRAPILVNYHLNRLMGLSEPLDYLVTLNGAGRVDEARVLARMAYRHPIFTMDAVSAQRRLAGLNTARTAFAGAYHGWGFHEDGCRSGVRAAAAFGVRW
ncbi:COG2907: Amine oxidase, flavin-containing [Alloactinosynnema sp. L-07]|uniref:NAD(P)/FAD-dependent oxidoreductase n=1 Tax=Alloactinosynnema sp. L-07 TaxID=1653480 RepID=UPI00065F01AB|nr:FAD-dependent oxidoreductase [Alloactinosynnema sp. L-07]CRK57688.1 COG2907: Amine oxidase, flavin-containing [Alloactinosynnema sp. L-07]